MSQTLESAFKSSHIEFDHPEHKQLININTKDLLDKLQILQITVHLLADVKSTGNN